MATVADIRFMQRLAKRIGTAGLRRARPKVSRASRTLARALVLKVRVRESKRRATIEAAIHIPHYWAIYVHDGRKPFRKGRYMVWWRNPKLDPRLQGGKTSKRAGQLRRLNRIQWEAALQSIADWVSAGGDIYDAPVVITKAIRKPTAPTKFFGNAPGEGMHGFINDAGRIVDREFSRHVVRSLGDLLTETDTATVRL